MSSQYIRLHDCLSDVADAIRSKNHGEGVIKPKNFASAINALEVHKARSVASIPPASSEYEGQIFRYEPDGEAENGYSDGCAYICLEDEDENAYRWHAVADVSGDTVSAGDLILGTTAHSADGGEVTGTLVKPVMNAANFTINSSNQIVPSNPATNGNFASGVKIYVNNALAGSSAGFSAIDLSRYADRKGTNYLIGLSVYSPGFADSSVVAQSWTKNTVNICMDASESAKSVSYSISGTNYTVGAGQTKSHNGLTNVSVNAPSVTTGTYQKIALSDGTEEEPKNFTGSLNITPTYDMRIKFIVPEA